MTGQSILTMQAVLKPTWATTQAKCHMLFPSQESPLVLFCVAFPTCRSAGTLGDEDALRRLTTAVPFSKP